jgi:nucleotide-binding universal stress UspA family protein
LDHLERGNFDLLAMATHGRTGPTCLVMGSVVEKVLRSTSVLVLLFRASGKVTGAGRQPISATYGKKGR